MRKVLVYLINTLMPAVRWGVPLALIALLFCLFRKYSIKKTVYWSFFFAYIGALIGETVLHGETYMTLQYNLIPFVSLTSNVSARNSLYIIQVIFNLVMFIPLGVFLKLGNWTICRATIAGFLLSLGIELSELILKTGIFDVDDLIMNTIGAVCGFLIAVLYINIHAKRKESE